MTLKTLTLHSPVKGNLIDLSKIPDEAFAQKMLGDGIAIKPQENFIYSPTDAVVKTLHKCLHAIVLEKDGLEILIHIGIDSVSLKGQRFKTFIQEGDHITKGQKLIEFDKDFLAQYAKDNTVVMVIVSPQNVTLKKENLQEIDSQAKVLEVVYDQDTKANKTSNNNSTIITEEFSVSNKTGLHARPAGEVAKLAQGFTDTDVFIIKNGREANAKSVVEILRLSIDYGDKIQIKSQGLQANEATEEIKKFIQNDDIKGTMIKNNDLQTFQTLNKTGETKIKGIGIFDGLSIGKSYLVKDIQFKLEEKSTLTPEEELSKFLTALNHVKSALDKERHAIYGQKEREEILLAHITILEDPFLIQETRQAIAKGYSAAFAFSSAVERAIDVLKNTGNEILRSRIADFIDLESRLLTDLTGTSYGLPDFKEDTILIAKELLSHHLRDINSHVTGIIMAEGSTLSHVSIMIKNLGIPTIIGTGPIALDIPDGKDIILDSRSGTITVDPVNMEEIKQKVQSIKVSREKNLLHAFEEARTIDGTEIIVSGNIGTIEQAEQSAQQGAQGIGLVRTEFLFANTQKPPTEQEQYEIYQKIADLQKGNPVIIRTLDVGADKHIPFMPQIREDNPILGRRGIRTSFANVDLFKTQLRAIMKVKPYGIAKIMIPMVTFIEEIRTVRRFVKEEQEKLGIDKVSLGMMMEVPAAAIMAKEFAKEADFFSIGTNDLTQYTLALDRSHPTLNFLSDSLNPSVLLMINSIVEGAKSQNIPVGVCGAVASEPAGAILLIGLGIRALSVVPTMVADIKALIRQLDIKKCQRVAQQSLTCKNVAEVRTLVKMEFNL
ncbi:MAG: phosphoenolpyruvate--protein phosphotransferase [Elusimicrobiaceae bacterium]|nr:phosphoenolpyruvate--protein phosphotransferase [Elusimicrobiaceae bacterium]